MDPSRKRTVRLVVALSAAVLLATALIYTSFTASTKTRTPSQLLAAAPTPGQSYELTGKVADRSCLCTVTTTSRPRRKWATATR